MRWHVESSVSQGVLLLAGLGVALLSGCGSEGPKLACVIGTVTVDGKPLAGATVEFQPAEGSPSMGVTDNSGRYELRYTARKAGAMLGRHQVRISHAPERRDAEGNLVVLPESLPAKFNRVSELVADVRSGSNQLDFPLRIR